MSDDELKILTDFRSEVPEPGDDTARRVYARATAPRAGRRRRPRRARLVIAVAVAALVLVPAGFGVDRLLTSNEGLGGSTNTSICTLQNASGGGRVYVEMAVSPESLEPQACSDLQQRFGGLPFRMTGKVGTGRVYCRWNDFHRPEYVKEIGIFASSGQIGLDFCRTFDPGPGFVPYHARP